MKEVTCKLFRFNELSEEVRKELIKKNRWDLAYNVMDCRESEYRATLEAFEKLFGINVRNWEVDYCGCRFCLEDFYPIGEYCNEISAKEIKGKYILRILNQHWNELFPFKRFWGKFQWDENGKSLTRKRYSKILRNYDGCPLTGICYDYDILEPIMEWLKNPDMKISFYDLLDNCVGKFFRAWQKEYEYWCDNEDNCLEEEFENRHEDDWFFSDGREFVGIYEDAA